MNEAAAKCDAGYWIEEAVFSAAECDALATRLADESMERGRAGARHLMTYPAIAAVSRDERLLRIARRALGEQAIAYRATLFEKSGRANWLVVWHQDTALPLRKKFEDAEWGPWSRKAGIDYAHAPTWALSQILALRLHLDASTSENGPLRALPASHLRGVMSDEEVFAYVKNHAPVECLVPRGGVLAMRPLLIHSSSKARSASPRRVLHIEYTANLKLTDGLTDGIELAIA